MKTYWLNRKGNTDCILFFNGWGMDESVVSHLQTDGYDVCMFYCYSNTSFVPEEFSGYNRLFVIGWSMGVAVANWVLAKLDLKIDKALALNGTGEPCNDTYGIPVSVFSLTLKNWGEKSSRKFYMRMFGGSSVYKGYLDLLPKRSIKSQYDELLFLQKEALKGRKDIVKWDKVIIGSEDLIFLPQNQINYWKDKIEMKLTNEPHYPFLKFKSWKQIIGQEGNEAR